jgi:hypothetical protein
MAVTLILFGAGLTNYFRSYGVVFAAIGEAAMVALCKK